MKTQDNSQLLQLPVVRVSGTYIGWAALVGVVALCAWSRDLLVDQAQLMTNAAQFLDGRTLYTVLPDTHLPVTAFLYSIPVILARFGNLPPILAFNIFVSCLTGLSALAATRLVAGRYRPGLAAVLASIAFLGQNDALFGQRESLFQTVWLSYLVARLNPPREAPILALVVGLTAGLMTAVKPQFLAYALVNEALLLWWTRSLRHPALISAAVAGTSVILLLFTCFDWRSYLNVLQFAAAYYRIVGQPASTVLADMGLSPSLQAAAGLIAACLVWWAWQRRLPRLAILLLATALVTVPLTVQQGEARSYYFIGITLPALMLGAMVAAEAAGGWIAPGGEIGRGQRSSWSRAGLGRLTVCAIVVVTEIWVMSGPDVGVAAQAWERVSNGMPVALFGPPAADPLVTDWERRSRPGETFAILDAQYGSTAFDPIVSAIRLRQTIYSRYNGTELAFLFALADGDRQRLRLACDDIASDLAFAHATWLYVRRDVPPWAKPGDFDDQLHAVPQCATAIDRNYREVGQFDRYVVYRRR